jgi:hypothetical protein
MRFEYRPILAGVLAAFVTGAATQAQPATSQLQYSALATGEAANTQPAPARLFSPTLDRGSPFVRSFTDGEWYFSWGYNKENWSHSDIHVSQPSLGNEFTVHDVQGHDEAGLSGGIFSGDLFGPQYNLRIGRFINDARTIGVEISLDHTKYTATYGQTAQVTGTIGGVPVNGNYKLDNSFFTYMLHNGANNLMVNAVYRQPLIGKTNETFSVAGIAKAGVGIMVPHVSDTILGQPNYVGDKTLNNLFGIHNGWWQIGDGWTTGAEVGFRFVVFAPIYLELTDKVTYSSLYDLPAYAGTMRQSIWMNQIIFSLGFTYDGASKQGAH